MNNLELTVLCGITEEQVKEIAKYKTININDINIDEKDIYVYGEINFDSKQDIEYINKFNLVNKDNGSIMYSNFNYEKGNATFEDIIKNKSTFDPIEWFKYNYSLIGKPKYILLYKYIKV